MFKTLKLKNIENDKIKLEGEYQGKFNITNDKTFIIMEEDDNIKVFELLETSTKDSQLLDPSCLFVKDVEQNLDIMIKGNKIYELEYDQLFSHFKDAEMMNISFTEETEKIILDLYNQAKKTNNYEKVVFSDSVYGEPSVETTYDITKTNKNDIKLSDVYKKFTKYGVRKFNDGHIEINCLCNIENDRKAIYTFNKEGISINQELEFGDDEFINKKLFTNEVLGGEVIMKGNNLHQKYSEVLEEIERLSKEHKDISNCFTVQDLETGSNKIKKLSELDNYQIYAEDNVQIDVYIDDVKKFHYKYENERDVIHFNQETKQISTDKGIKPLKGPDKDPDKTL